jgi:predicted 3-demethylubiquinone-9 3-methyltransferase (glyoxalase superfamily)
MSLSVIPYLSFEGDCEEAIRLYMEIFGGKTLYLSRWSELNEDPFGYRWIITCPNPDKR